MRYPVRLRSAELSGSVVSAHTEDIYGEDIDISITFYRNGTVGFLMGSDPGHDFVVSSARVPAGGVTVAEEGSRVVCACGSITVEIRRDPYALTVYNDEAEIWHEHYDDYDSVGEGGDLIPPTGFAIDEDGTASVRLCSAIRPDESYYGLGERFGEFDKRGQHVIMCNYDTLGCRDEKSYKNIPFFVSSSGYGLFVNHPGLLEFDFGARSNASLTIRVPGNQAEWFLLPGRIIEAVPLFVSMTGNPALPPDWSFGLWYSNGFKDSTQELVEMYARRLKEYSIPVSVIHLDCYWMRDDQWCDFVWEEERFPDPKAMIRVLHEDGYRVCVWINPYVTNRTEMFREGSSKGYFLTNSDGEVYEADLWHGLLSPLGIVDFSNPEADAWFREKVRDTLRLGVDVIKTDFGEEIPLDAVFHNGRSGAQMRNLYSVLFNLAVYETTAEIRGAEDAMVWARSGTAGMHRYPVCWSGDPRSSWQGMAATLRGGLSAALSGILFWSHDIGGFYGNVSDEVYVRWAQFGLFCSHARLHGTTERAPWAFGPEASRIVCDMINLREEFMPYILKTAGTCVQTGMPFIAPLLMRHCDDPAVAHIWDEYYFGPDMIVAPVFGGDGALRVFYLPEGRWRDHFTGEVFPGKQWYSRRMPLERFPLLVRVGNRS